MPDSNQFKLAGVMGMPIIQSRSPIIHNHWIGVHQLKAAYGHLPVQIDQVEAAVRGLAALGMAGCNITLPHKVKAMTLMDHLSPMAQRVGAINCIVVQADGSLHGHNHDGYGYIQSLKDEKPDWRADTGPITILGAGGAARAVIFSLIDAGARDIRLLNRSRDKAEQLAALNPSLVQVHEWSERHAALGGAAMLVNTTSQGMYDQAALDLQLDDLPLSAMVSDLIYVPLETPLVKAAKARGHMALNGLGMLLNQAVPAFEAWFGIKPVIDAVLRQKILATFN
ncbi:MAG: shikimate dehydrogenase [Betaproteobacteria bacterium]|nr:shikimate dehydrogenase [Betaproteobacteria bacterium]NBY04264.1 shikimate dehydrogenase [Betaproteobacteria bacterium]